MPTRFARKASPPPNQSKGQKDCGDGARRTTARESTNRVDGIGVEAHRRVEHVARGRATWRLGKVRSGRKLVENVVERHACPRPFPVESEESLTRYRADLHLERGCKPCRTFKIGNDSELAARADVDVEDHFFPHLRTSENRVGGKEAPLVQANISRSSVIYVRVEGADPPLRTEREGCYATSWHGGRLGEVSWHASHSEGWRLGGCC